MKRSTYVARLRRRGDRGGRRRTVLCSPRRAELEERWAMLDKYCVGCHNDAELTGDLSLEHRKPDGVVQDARVWKPRSRSCASA